MGLVKLNDRGVRSATTFGSLNTGSMTFIKKLTASSSATLSFVDGTSDVVLDSTYKEYMFTFKDIHPSDNGERFSFQGNVAGGADYNETITSTSFGAYHNEADDSAALGYDTGEDQAQGTAFQSLVQGAGSDNDQASSGELWLFNPSSTTFVKHFMARTNHARHNDSTEDVFTAGYFNTTSAIDEIQFKMSADCIQAGTICLYGIK